MHDDVQNRFEASPNVTNHFAWLRTRLGLERTFLAWIRTAVSLIGFGFTITQFFQRLQETEGSRAPPMPVQAPRDLGLTLIAVGVGVLAISTWQYRLQLKYLWSAPFSAIAGMNTEQHRTPVLLAAMAIMVIGIAAFGAILMRWV